MTRRVLIVSPHFPPVNAPDHQRVRMSLPYLNEFGWQADVLAVDPEYVNGFRDPLLAACLPSTVKIARSAALSARLTGLIGIRGLAFRSFGHLMMLGNRLLSENNYSLVFFSTTLFPVLALGPLWHKRFGVPYVIDLQDPWISDYYASHRRSPPGGVLKYGLSQMIAHVLEPYVLRKASAIISVSPQYPKVLCRRYPWLRESRLSVLPFAAAETDFAVSRALDVKQRFFDPHDGRIHWVYVGRGGPDMALALRALFRAFQRARATDPARFHNVRMHFLGTDYAEGAMSRKTIDPLAAECGVEDAVEELTGRIPYFEALQCLLEADALMVIGSDDPGYTASKIYPYILAKKPLLAVFHEESSVVDIVRSTQAGTVVTFRPSDDEREIAQRITENWFNRYGAIRPAVDWNIFEKYTARSMTKVLCARLAEALDE